MTLGSTESTTTRVSGEREMRSLVRYSALMPSDKMRKKGRGEECEGGKEERRGKKEREG